MVRNAKLMPLLRFYMIELSLQCFVSGNTSSLNSDDYFIRTDFVAINPRDIGIAFRRKKHFSFRTIPSHPCCFMYKADCKVKLPLFRFAENLLTEQQNSQKYKELATEFEGNLSVISFKFCSAVTRWFPWPSSPMAF